MKIFYIFYSHFHLVFSFSSLVFARLHSAMALSAVGPPPPPLPPPLKAPSSSSSSSSQPTHYGPGSQTKSGSMTNGNNFYLHKHINSNGGGVGSQQNAMIFNTTGATSSSSSGQQQNAQHDYYNQLPQQQQLVQHQNGEGPDSDSGLEVVEESTLKPSDLIRGNHNRSMSIISGKCPSDRSIDRSSNSRFS